MRTAPFYAPDRNVESLFPLMSMMKSPGTEFFLIISDGVEDRAKILISDYGYIV